MVKRSSAHFLLLLALGCAGGEGELSAGPGALKDGGPEAGACVPATCLGLAAECGKTLDQCGEVLACGDCPTGEFCGGAGANRCGTTACVAKTCVSLGAQCGLASDGCEDVLSCGECQAPLICGGDGQDNQCGCRAKSCVELGAQCGSIADGCGAVIDCGDCPTGQHCGGETPNICGSTACTPKTCSDLGASCGSVSDGCSATLDCGACTAPETCAGGGTPNHCGCTPTNCSVAGAKCGTASDGCGSTIQCGACPTGETCASNQCVCANGWKSCGSTCIPNSACCTNSDCDGLTVCATPGQDCSCRTSPSRPVVYRSYHPNGDHLLSVNPDEGTPYGYVSEGPIFHVYAAPCQWGLVPFRRVLNPNSGEHFFTASQGEFDHLVNTGWINEGVLGCIAQSAECGAIPLYRLAKVFHIFTPDASERDALISQGWVLENNAGYVWSSP